MQLQLPVQPPMALLANKTADGLLGLRWSKIKLGCGSGAVIKTVQASSLLSSLLQTTAACMCSTAFITCANAMLQQHHTPAGSVKLECR